MDANDAPSPHQQPQTSRRSRISGAFQRLRIGFRRNRLVEEAGAQRLVVDEDDGRVDAPISSISHEPFKLPDEALMRLAQHLWQPELVALSQVCASWRHQLLAMPTLWTQVGTRPGMRAPPLDTLLLRTGSHAFTFEAVVTAANVGSVGLALRSHIGRCRSLTLRLYDIDIPVTTAELVAALSLPVPRLQSLTLYDISPQFSLGLAHAEGRLNGRLFSGHAPELRTLILTGNLAALTGCVALRRVTDLDYHSHDLKFSHTLLVQLFPELRSWGIMMFKHAKLPSVKLVLPSGLQEFTLNSHHSNLAQEMKLISYLPHVDIPKITLDLSISVWESQQDILGLISAVIADGRDVKIRLSVGLRPRTSLDVSLDWTVVGRGTRSRMIRSVPHNPWNDTGFLTNITVLWCTMGIFAREGSFSPDVEWANLDVLHLLSVDQISISKSNGPPNLIHCPKLRLIYLHGEGDELYVQARDLQAFVARHLNYDRGVRRSLTPWSTDNFPRADYRVTSDVFSPEVICFGCKLLSGAPTSRRDTRRSDISVANVSGSMDAEESERNPF